MSLRALSRRLERLERGTGTHWPHVVGVRWNETEDEAFARMQRQYGDIPEGHRLIVVPEVPREPEDIAAVDKLIEEQQAKLLEECRDEDARSDELNNRPARANYN